MAPAPAGASSCPALGCVRVLRPVDSSRRVVGVDVARALALIGMAATHIFPGFTPDGDLHLVARRRRPAAPPRCSPCWPGSAWRWCQAVTGRWPGEPLRGARAGVLARAALLLVARAAARAGRLAAAGDPGLLRAALRRRGARSSACPAATLAILAAVAAVVTPLASYALRQWVDPTPIDEPGGRDLLVELFLTGTYPVLTWTTYLFAGLAVGRSHLRRLSVAAELLVGGAALAVVAKLASAVLLGLVGGRSELAVVDRTAARAGRRPARRRAVRHHTAGRLALAGGLGAAQRHDLRPGAHRRDQPGSPRAVPAARPGAAAVVPRAAGRRRAA